MKRNTIAILASLAVAIFTFSACSNFLGATPTAAAQAVKTGYGSFTVKIPNLASWTRNLVAAPSTSKGLEQSRAFVAADRAVLTVKGRNATTLTSPDTWTVTYATASQQTSPTLLGDPTNASLPFGDYTLTVQIFDAVTSTTVPVVQGSVDFSLVDGNPVNLFVTCLPVSATPISDGTTHPDPIKLSNQYLGTAWAVTTGTGLASTIGSTSTVASHGAEKWFSFYATTGYSSVTMTPVAGSTDPANPVFVVFDDTGAQLSLAYGSGPGSANTATFITTTSASFIYYIAAIDIAGTTATANAITRAVDITVASATPVSAANRLLSYSLWSGAPNTGTEYKAYIDQYSDNVTIPGIPPGTDLSTLYATFTLSGGATLAAATAAQTSGQVNTLATSYSVFANNGYTSLTVTPGTGSTTRSYKVYIPSADQDYLSNFVVGGVTGVITEDSANDSTIVVSGLPSTFNLATAVATFTSSPGATVTVAGVAQISGTTANNFSTSGANIVLTYNVANGTNSRNYDVVLLQTVVNNLITQISVKVGNVTYNGVVNQASGKIFLGPVPYRLADLTLVPVTFTLSGAASVSTFGSSNKLISGSKIDFYNFNSGTLANDPVIAYITPTGVTTGNTMSYNIYLMGDL